MYEDSLLDAQYEDRFYVEDDLDQDEDECADGHDLRVYDDFHDQCVDCGTIVEL